MSSYKDYKEKALQNDDKKAEENGQMRTMQLMQFMLTSQKPQMTKSLI